MAYKNTFKGILKPCKIDGIKRDFKLSNTIINDKGKSINNPSDMTISQFSDYITENYTKKNTIEKVELINDLVVFKSYKAYLEEFVKKDASFSNFISEISNLFIGLTAVIIAMGKDEYTVTKDSTIKNVCFIVKSKQPKDFIDLFYLFLFLMFIRLVIYFMRVSKHDNSEKLKTVNNAIYILEALKEEVYNNPDCQIEKIKIKRFENLKKDEQKLKKTRCRRQKS